MNPDYAYAYMKALHAYVFPMHANVCGVFAYMNESRLCIRIHLRTVRIRLHLSSVFKRTHVLRTLQLTQSLNTHTCFLHTYMN